MKFPVKNLLFIALSVIIFSATQAEATWKEVDDCTPDIELNDKLDTDTCSFRLKFAVTRDRGIPPYEENLLYNINEVARVITIETDEVSKVAFYANIPYRDLKTMLYSGAISQTAYNTINEIYRDNTYKPLHLIISLVRGLQDDSQVLPLTSSVSLILECFYLEEGYDGEHTFTSTISEEYFTLEAQCVIEKLKNK